MNVTGVAKAALNQQVISQSLLCCTRLVNLMQIVDYLS